jgi:hypothetical protein
VIEAKRVSNCIFKILKIVLFSRQRREKIAGERGGADALNVRMLEC